MLFMESNVLSHSPGFLFFHPHMLKISGSTYELPNWNLHCNIIPLVIHIAPQSMRSTSIAHINFTFLLPADKTFALKLTSYLKFWGKWVFFWEIQRTRVESHSRIWWFLLLSQFFSFPFPPSHPPVFALSLS